ncbi:hypothetical protein CJU90_2044 [Yarrowia sp. C11]|nr:hypothetical protein CJU90_2044 [Yarrowia sp. C11]
MSLPYHMTLPLSQDSPEESPRGDSRFSRFFKNVRGNDSRDSIATYRLGAGNQSQDDFRAWEYPPNDESRSFSGGLPTTPDVDVNQYFSQLQKSTGYELKLPEKPRDLDTPEQRGMLGVYEDFMRAQRGKQWKDGDFDFEKEEELVKEEKKERNSRDLKLSPKKDMSRDLGTYDWAWDADNTTLTPADAPSSFYSLHKENPYSEDGSHDKSREVYDYVNRSEARDFEDNVTSAQDSRSSPDSGSASSDSASGRISRVFFALTLTCLLIILKTHVTTVILNYGIDDSLIYSQTACSTLNTYAATTHFGPNLLYSAVTGQAAGHVQSMADGLVPQGDITYKTPDFVASLLSQLKQDYLSSLLDTIDFGVDLARDSSSRNAEVAHKMLSEQLGPLQDNLTVIETSLESLSESFLENPIFGFEKSGQTSTLTLDHVKSLNFSDVFFSDFLPLFKSSSDVSSSFDDPISSAKNAMLTDFDNFHNGVRKLGINLPQANTVAEQLENTSYKRLFSSFKLCSKEDEIKEHYEKMEKGVNSKSGGIIVTFAVFAVIFFLVMCFLEFTGLIRKKRVQKVRYLRRLKLTESQTSHVEPAAKSKWSREYLPFPHLFSTLTIVTVAVAISCLCDLSLLSSLRISGGAQIEFVTDVESGVNGGQEIYGHVTEPIEHVTVDLTEETPVLAARDLKDSGYAPVDYMAIFSTATPPTATNVPVKAVQNVQKNKEEETDDTATLHDISTDITRLIDAANIYLEGLQTNLKTECLSYQSELVKSVNSTLNRLEGEFKLVVSKRFGLENPNIGFLNYDKFLSAVLDRSSEAVAAGTARQFKIDPEQAVVALKQAHISSLPGFAPLQTKTTIATSLENLVDMMHQVVLSQQWFALGLFMVWILVLVTGGVRWVLKAKKNGGITQKLGIKGKKWEV